MRPATAATAAPRLADVTASLLLHQGHQVDAIATAVA
jgi:hypothetical protein